MIHRVFDRLRCTPLPAFILTIGLAGLLASGCSRQETRMDGIGTEHPSRPDVHQALAVTAKSPAKFQSAADRPATRLSGGPVAIGKEEVIHVPGPNLPVAPGNQPAPQPEALPIPLAAVGFNPALKLNPQQVAQLVQLGQAFLAVTDATPSVPQSSSPVEISTKTPSTSARSGWLSAQSESDQLFRAMFGYSAFNAQLLLRAQQAAGK